MPRVALLIDAPPDASHRVASEASLAHAMHAAGVAINVEVLPTSTLASRDIADFQGVFVGPGSPYDEPEAVLDWIREARERGIPLVGT